MSVVIEERRRDRGTRAAITMIGCATAQHAVVRGKHEPELRHAPAQDRRHLRQVHAQTGFGQIERRALPTDAAADDEHCSVGIVSIKRLFHKAALPGHTLQHTSNKLKRLLSLFLSLPCKL